mgnify:CR=1 FL=1
MSEEEIPPQDKSAATGVPTMAASAAPAPAPKGYCQGTEHIMLLLVLSACAIVGVVELGAL